MNNFKSSFGSSPFNNGSLDEYRQNNEMNEQNRGVENNNSNWGFSSRFSNSGFDRISPFQSLQNRRLGLGDGGSFDSNEQPRSPFGRMLFSNDSPFLSSFANGQWTNTSRFNSNNGRFASPFENSTVRSPFGGQAFNNGKYVSPFRNSIGNFGSLTRTNGPLFGPQGNQNFPNQQFSNPYGQYGQQSPIQQPYSDPYANNQQYAQQAPVQQPYNNPYGTQAQQPYNNPYGTQAQQPYNNPYGTQAQQPYNDPYGTQAQQPYNDPYANQQYEQQPMQQSAENDEYANQQYDQQPVGDSVENNDSSYADDSYGGESYEEAVANSIPNELDESDVDVKAKHALFVWSPELNDWDLVGNFRNLKKAESKKKKMMASKKHNYSDEWFSISPV